MKKPIHNIQFLYSENKENYTDGIFSTFWHLMNELVVEANSTCILNVNKQIHTEGIVTEF
jgi:hypothetical protein